MPKTAQPPRGPEAGSAWPLFVPFTNLGTSSSTV